MQRMLAAAVLCLCTAGLASADGGDVCIVAQAKATYDQMVAADAAGRAGEAYEAAARVDSYCISSDERERARIEAQTASVLARSSKTLGAAAEEEGRFAQAYDYYRTFHGIDADRVQLKRALSKPDDLASVREGIYYMRSMQNTLRPDVAGAGTTELARARLSAMNHGTSQDTVDAMDPDRQARLQAVNGDLVKLEALAAKHGDELLADEEKVFAARKTSITAKMSSLDELEHAKAWLELARQQERADARAVKRGDTLVADDGRTSIQLAIAYYEFARDEPKVESARRKAQRLGDVHLQQGEKKVAAEYYEIAGLDAEASELLESDEAEKEQAEASRQEKFKKDQDELEKELGF